MNFRRLIVLFPGLLLFGCLSNPDSNKRKNWEVYRGGAESNAYSGLDQINPDNVSQLKVAWTFHTEDSGSTIECNPIVKDEVMYLTSPALKLMAVNAVSGKLIWEFDPFQNEKPKGVNRGVTYWEDG